MKEIILPKLSKTEKLILYLIYKFRYLTQKQFQKLLKHKSHTGVSTWLNGLILKGVISNDFKREWHTQPGVYFVTELGIEALKTIEKVNKVSLYKMKSDANRSDAFKKYCLFITDIYIKYLELAGKDEVQFLTQNEMGRDIFLPKKHKPSAYIAISHNGQVVRRYFLKIFKFIEPPYAIKSVIDQLMEYATDGEWEAVTKNPFPAYLFVIPTEPVKGYMYKHIRDTYYDEDGEVFLSTWGNIKVNGVGKDAWQKIKRD